MICESTQELIPQDMFVCCGNQVKKTTKKVCSDFWNKLGKKTEGGMTDSREWTADTLYNDLESVALTIEGTNPNCHWGRQDAYDRIHSRHQEETTGDQIRSSKITMWRMSSSSKADDDRTYCCSTVFQDSTSTSTSLQGRCHYWRCQYDSMQILQKATYSKIFTILQLSWCWERCNVRSIRDVHLKADFILIIIPKSFFSVSLSKWSRLLLHDYSLMKKVTWTQNYENTLEQFVWANAG